MPGPPSDTVFSPRIVAESEGAASAIDTADFTLHAPIVPASPGRLAFSDHGIAVGYETAEPTTAIATEPFDPDTPAETLNALSTLKPLGPVSYTHLVSNASIRVSTTTPRGGWATGQRASGTRLRRSRLRPSGMMDLGEKLLQMDVDRSACNFKSFRRNPIRP